MTRDFAVNLAEFFWHMTHGIYASILLWLLTTHDMGVLRRPSRKVFFIFLTDDMGVIDQIDR